MSILIIDPDIGPDVPVRQVFEEQGFEHLGIVKTVVKAREFLAEKQQSQGVDNITLIIINSELDQGDGFELCREIRKTELGQRAYIIVLVSSVNNSVAIEKARYCGADDFSVKPYNGNEFLKHLMIFAHKKAVFLVEDDPVIRQLVTSLLNKKHVEIIVSDDGLHAYNLINSIAPPKLVLLDIGLPNMSGLKLVKQMRARSLWRNTPIIMLTSSTSASDVKQSLGSGANEYIVKPFQVSSFSERIAKYFDEDK